MNPFNVDDRNLLNGAAPPHQPIVPRISTTNPAPQYFGTQTVAPNIAPNFATVNANFYTSIPTRSPAHDQHHAPDGLDIFPQSPYEAAETAAKEERRRRNTAASARFRQKKKHKEEAMESRMARVQERNSELEERVSTLELENKWLKDLITEKNRAPTSDSGDERDERDEREDPAFRQGSTHRSSATEDGESSV